MLIKVRTRVSAIRTVTRYPVDAKGQTNYSKPAEVLVSTLRVLDNNAGIKGDIEVDEQLPFGAFYSITVNTDQPTPVEETPKTEELEAPLAQAATTVRW